MFNHEDTIENFHKIYYGDSEPHTWQKTFWLGRQTLKCPLDLWIYQEIIHDIKPDIIIETGTWNGGSTLFLAAICDIIHKGKIFSIDIEKSNLPLHNRIQFLTGSSTDIDLINSIKNSIRSDDKVMVILDSDHSKVHVLKELEIYSELVSTNSYLIVEDTNINGYPVLPDWGPGPMEAVNEFLKKHDEFIVDKEKEKFLMTFNPNGYLKKIS